MAEVGGTYSFLDVRGAIVGPGLFAQIGQGSGAAEEGIELAMVGDKNTMTIGADGTPMHSLHAGRGATYTIRLLKTSVLNQVLAQAYAFQTSGGSANHGQNTITFSNLQTGDNITGRFGAFKKLSDIGYAVEGGMNTWVFDVGYHDVVLGGGTPARGAGAQGPGVLSQIGGILGNAGQSLGF